MTTTALAKVMARMRGLSGREAGKALNDLNVSEVREYLVNSGVLTDPLRLRGLVDSSLSMVGGEDECSSVVSALEPAEIAAVAAISPEIFFDAIDPSDYNDATKWRFLSKKELNVIRESGDKALQNRLANFHCVGSGGGPWAIFIHDVAVSPLGVESYFNAICNADRATEWKEEALEAILDHLVAISSLLVYERCRREFPGIAERLRSNARRKDTAMADLKSNWRDGLTAIEKELVARNVTVPKRDLASALHDLRQAGIEDPTTDQVVAQIEDSSTFEELLTSGLPPDNDRGCKG